MPVHFPTCRADYPEKSDGEAPQALTRIDLTDGEWVEQCVDCGAIINSHLEPAPGWAFDTRGGETIITQPGITQQGLRDEAVCEHGTAMDVHCCGCHSGFLFDSATCTCLNPEPEETT